MGCIRLSSVGCSGEKVPEVRRQLLKKEAAVSVVLPAESRRRRSHLSTWTTYHAEEFGQEVPDLPPTSEKLTGIGVRMTNLGYTSLREYLGSLRIFSLAETSMVFVVGYRFQRSGAHGEKKHWSTENIKSFQPFEAVGKLLHWSHHPVEHKVAAPGVWHFHTVHVLFHSG